MAAVVDDSLLPEHPLERAGLARVVRAGERGVALRGVVPGAGRERGVHRVRVARVLLEGRERVRGRGARREEARDGRGRRRGVVGRHDDDVFVGGVRLQANELLEGYAVGRDR